MEIRKICVFCGSSMGKNSAYRTAAENFADVLRHYKIDLVYGGANVGLMKVLAEKILAGGREVTGVMPRNLLAREVAHTGLSKLHIVDSMQERKLLMADISDAFVAMPGGFGTLDELAEMLTFNQLRIHDKPLGILNIHNYFDELLHFFDHNVKEGFVRPEHRNNLIVDHQPEALIKKLLNYQPVEIEKWIRDIKIESSD